MNTFYETYEIKSTLGKGGMSTVYLVEHKRLHNNWAVKEVKKNQAIHFDFLAESNILKRLQHAMLPRIVDIFESDDSVYIVEDYVEGITLEEYLKQRGKVGEQQGLQWYRDLCDVLGYLHRQQPHPIIYRDLKPANIMIQPDGTLKLIDFGIAREYKQDSNADTTYIGTKGYAAPEQFGTAQTDARTDIYSLGVTMYHLLTGKSPYEPPYQFVPARELNRHLSHGMEFILNKCIQPEPVSRYQTVDEVIGDLDHIYKFDKAYKKYVATKRWRIAVLLVMFTASITLIMSGRFEMGQEKQVTYNALLEQASQIYTSNPNQAFELLEQARTLFDDKPESYRQYTYALHQNGTWQDCIDYGETALLKFPGDGQLLLTIASAYFELGQYPKAAEYYRAGAQNSILNESNLRDYAVSLGRTGDTDSMEQVLEQLLDIESTSELTTYVRAEVSYANKEFTEAEKGFLSILDSSEDITLQKRALRSVAEVYRDCAVLAKSGDSPIEMPAQKAVKLLAIGIEKYGLGYDTTLWEMLGLAYFDSHLTDSNADTSYLNKAAESFNRVIELGISKNYLYSNLYMIYYELGDFDSAQQVLLNYEASFPDDYLPHALRGMMIITIENKKEQSDRDYSEAVSEYEKAGTMIRSSDDTAYYQQLKSLIDQLQENGWL